MALDVVLESVSMRFGETVALSDIDVSVPAGGVLNFVGPPGSGKTTILRLIAGLNEPTAGRVLIGGRDMAGVAPTERPTGLILYNLPVYPLMRVWENVVFHLNGSVQDRARRREQARALLAPFGLTDAGDRALIELEPLDRLRVAIAGVLAAGPEVLLLDEPLEALPASMAEPLLDDLVALHGRSGLTTIHISEDAGLARRFGGRIAHMNSGRIEKIEEL